MLEGSNDLNVVLEAELPSQVMGLKQKKENGLTSTERPSVPKDIDMVCTSFTCCSFVFTSADPTPPNSAHELKEVSTIHCSALRGHGRGADMSLDLLPEVLTRHVDDQMRIKARRGLPGQPCEPRRLKVGDDITKEMAVARPAPARASSDSRELSGYPVSSMFTPPCDQPASLWDAFDGR